MIPRELEERLKLQLGGEYAEFEGFLSTPAKTTFRVNTLKAEVGEVLEGLEEFAGKSGSAIEPIPWLSNGFKTDAKVGESVEHFQGLIYIQEAASMLSAVALDPKPAELVLDLTAAPGSKTTQMAAMMENRGCIIANELNYKRLKTLRFNLNRMGVANTIVTNNDGMKFNSKMKFDKILLDAPCSNTGQLRDNPDATGAWSLSKVKNCAQTQMRLLDNAVKCLKDDGIIVYSTCTFAPEENEGVVDYAVREHGLKIEGFEGKFMRHQGMTEWGGRTYSSEVEKCVRIYPHENDTDGFFMARLSR